MIRGHRKEGFRERMQNKNRIEAMKNQKILPLIITMSVPAICANVANAIYNFVDRFFVGHYVSTDALGSIGLIFPLHNLTSALIIMLSIGGSVLMSRALGEAKQSEADKAFTNITVMAIVLAVCISLIFMVFTEPLVTLCGGTKSSGLFDLAVTYLRITAIGQFFIIVNLALAATIRAEGNTKYAMIVTLTGAVLNSLVDPVLIIGFHMGLAGAAWSTVFSQIVSCGLSFLYFYRGKSIIRWSGKGAIDLQVMIRILSLGAAPAIFQGLSFLNNTLINHFLMHYGNEALGENGGDLAISAISVISSIESFAIMFIMGMNNALSVIISFNYGMKQYDRVKKTTLTGQVIAMVVSVFVWSMMMFFPKSLFYLFSEDTALAEYGVHALHYGKLFVFGLGFQTLASMYYSSIKRPGRAVLISISRNGLFLIPALLIVPGLYGLNGVLACTSISDGCSLLLVAVMYFYGIRELNREIRAKAGRPETRRQE